MTARTTQRQLHAAIAGLMLVMLLSSLDQTIVSTAMPTIVGELGGLEHLSWVVTAYLLAVTAGTPLYGKLGDQYGRKVVLQGALVVFLVGSALCGLAQGMTELIAFRAVQGIGGGGLMVGAQAAIGDLVSPRDRGRYTGLFGAVFGVSAIAGPLIGGFLTSNVSWRSIFYVNLPLGALALVVLGVTLPSAGERVRHRIDWAGAAVLASGLSALILATTLGGTSYDWVSPQIGVLAVITLLALGGLPLVERRAAEPILPPSLLLNRVFVVVAAVSLVVGFALFGAMTYLPLFQQVVRGQSPTASGLQLLPVMGGLLITSTLTGQVITRTGRYRAFPIAGTAIAGIGMLLLSSLSRDTPAWTAAWHMLILGLGLGMVMQVLVLAAQNAVSYEELGVATSGATLFRSIGGSLGTAVLGAIFTARLNDELAARLPGGAQRPSAAGLDPTAIRRLPAAVRDAFIDAFDAALQHVFLWAAVVVGVAFLLSWLIPERPLRQTVETSVGDALGGPRDTDSLRELTRALSRAAGRERTLAFMEDTARRAGIELAPGPSWLLLRLGASDTHGIAAVLATTSVEPERVTAAHAVLREHDLADRDGELTEAGRRVRDELLVARTACLHELIADWEPDRYPELDPLLAQLAEELGPVPT